MAYKIKNLTEEVRRFRIQKNPEWIDIQPGETKIVGTEPIQANPSNFDVEFYDPGYRTEREEKVEETIKQKGGSKKK